MFEAEPSRAAASLAAAASAESVSYTHLDVYKRQSLSDDYRCFVLDPNPSGTGGIDVYKRQLEDQALVALRNERLRQLIRLLPVKLPLGNVDQWLTPNQRIDL